jgi:D-alanine-D-alanine ligase
MVEAFVPGRELTTTVLGDRALTVTDILTDGWYDYHAKYAARRLAPRRARRVPERSSRPAWTMRCCAPTALGCRGLSRTDFRWDEARGLDGLVLLETNTQPGMTPTSLTRPSRPRMHGHGFRRALPLDGGGRVMRPLTSAPPPPRP